MTNDFIKAFKKIQKAINTSANQAMNKALTNTKTLYAKKVASTLGVSSARIKKRAKVNKVNADSRKGSLDIGIRVKFAAQDFKPSKIKVESSKGKRTGATIKVGQGERTKIDGVFIAKAKSGKTLVISRVGDERYPTKTVLTNEFEKAVTKEQTSLVEYLRESFDKNLKSQLDFNLKK